MRSNVLVLCVLFVILLLSAFKLSSETGLFYIRLNQGTELAKGDYAPADHWRGQWRIVNIWAEWCKPCWQEIPELNRFYALQGLNEVQLLGFNFDELEQTELLQLKQKMSIQFPVLTSWPSAWEKPDIKGLPATIVISPEDEVKAILLGPQDSISLQQTIERAK